MARSAQVRAQDLEAIYRLINECRDLGDDPAFWRQHWFAGIASLAGAGIVMGGELTGVRAGQPRYTGTADWGWQNGFNRLGWERALAEMAADPRLARVLSMGDYLRQMIRDDGASLSRTDYLSDGYWYRSWEYENLPRACGVDHTLFCYHSLAGTADEFNGLFLARAIGDRDFSPREKKIVREAQRLIQPLVGRRLARSCDPSPSDLPLRGRQVLKCLLEGDSDKQVAARLGISRYTVNQYVKGIFRHFAVQSRPELLARWIKRGWSARCAWADDLAGTPGR